MAIEQDLEAVRATHNLPPFVAAATKDGALIHQSAHGVRNETSGAPMSLDTVFRIYSMTKAVTATAILQLAERGALELDAPASRYAPELDQVRVLTGFDADGAPRLRAPLRAPTVRHLLTHSSGFGYTLWNGDLLRYAGWAAQSGAPFNPMLDLPLAFDPGTMWEYGVGLDWAGRVVERVSGLGLDAYFEHNIFAPLGMSDTGFAVTPAMNTRLAESYRRGEGGALVRSPRGEPVAPTFLSGGGGLFGSPADYLAFLAVFSGGARTAILKPETIALMTRADSGAPPLRTLGTVMPPVTNDLNLWGGEDMAWSLAFLVNRASGANGRAAGSLAWAGLANTYYWVDPSNGLAAVLMMQLSPFADSGALALLGAFERALYAAL
mgnify:CR=1 FL=1